MKANQILIIESNQNGDLLLKFLQYIDLKFIK